MAFTVLLCLFCFVFRLQVTIEQKKGEIVGLERRGDNWGDDNLDDADDDSRDMVIVMVSSLIYGIQTMANL